MWVTCMPILKNNGGNITCTKNLALKRHEKESNYMNKISIFFEELSVWKNQNSKCHNKYLLL